MHLNGELLKSHLKGKTCSKLATGLKFYDLKKKLTSGVALTRPWGYIHVYYHSRQTVFWYISQVSGERLQDHWSSCFVFWSRIFVLFELYVRFHSSSVRVTEWPPIWE